MACSRAGQNTLKFHHQIPCKAEIRGVLGKSRDTHHATNPNLLQKVLFNVEQRGSGDKWGNYTPATLQALVGRSRACIQKSSRAGLVPAESQHPSSLSTVQEWASNSLDSWQG